MLNLNENFSKLPCYARLTYLRLLISPVNLAIVLFSYRRKRIWTIVSTTKINLRGTTLDKTTWKNILCLYPLSCFKISVTLEFQIALSQPFYEIDRKDINALDSFYQDLKVTEKNIGIKKCKFINCSLLKVYANEVIGMNLYCL